MNHPEEVKALMLGESQKAELVTESSIQHTPRPKLPPVTHQEAKDAAGAFIDEHFRNKSERKVVTCIPANNSDTDIVLCRYIAEQEEKSIEREALVSALRGLVEFIEKNPQKQAALSFPYQQAREVLASVSPKEKAIK